MLSGVGPRDHLEELKIPVIQDLKVGHNLQDHIEIGGLIFHINTSAALTMAMLNSNGKKIVRCSYF